LPLLSFGQSGTIQSVTIGNQVWMTKNLNVSSFRNGDPIPHAKTNAEWERAGEKGQPAWCYYDNDPANGEKYGKLYNWYAVNDPRGLAPKGWHIPSDEEWTVLTDYLGGEEEAGVKMKSKQGWAKGGNGTNSSGFSGLPGGLRLINGLFYNIGSRSSWWSFTEYDAGSAWNRGLSYYDGDVFSYYVDNKGNGMSVRCRRD
jgi:uncharacterized protein (TIGR02145 family)